MNIEYFNYNLPEELIAQTPIKNRSDSKMLVMDKKTGDLKDEIFKNVIDYLNTGDVLVLNDTKVLPARIFGKKIDTNAHIELLLLKNIENAWLRKVITIGVITMFSIFTYHNVVVCLSHGVTPYRMVFAPSMVIY